MAAKATRSSTRRPKRPAPRRAKRQEPQTLRLRRITPSFVVADLSKSLTFYCDMLGFVISERWEEGGVLQGVTLKAGSGLLMLGQEDFKKGRDRQKGIGHRLWLETVQNLDALAARVKALGTRLDYEPADMPWGARAFALSDPDGFRLTITQEL